MKKILLSLLAAFAAAAYCGQASAGILASGLPGDYTIAGGSDDDDCPIIPEPGPIPPEDPAVDPEEPGLPAEPSQPAQPAEQPAAPAEQPAQPAEQPAEQPDDGNAD